MQKKTILFMIIFISLAFMLYAERKIKKHFLSAKLAYINSEFKLAEEELQNALKEKEVPYNEVVQFLDLLRYIGSFVRSEYTRAEGYYNSKEYMNCIDTLSRVLKKNSNDKPTLTLYKKAYQNLNPDEKTKLKERLESEKEEYIRKKEEIYLISVYTELLLIDPGNKQIELALAKLKLKYKSRKMREEINKMIAKLKAEIQKQTFDIDKLEQIVADLLFLAPDNQDVKEISEILKEYRKKIEMRKKMEMVKKVETGEKKTDEKKTDIKEEIKLKDKSELKEMIIAKADEILLEKKRKPSKEIEKVKLVERVKQTVQVEDKKTKVNKTDLIKEQNKQIAQHHFNLGVNRYNKKKYYEAKEEFVYARVIDPELTEADRYIKQCEAKIKIEEARLKQDVNRAIKQAEVLVRKNQVEKAVKYVYKKIPKKDVSFKAAENYLNKIIKKKIQMDRMDINQYSYFYYVFELLKDLGNQYMASGRYSESLIIWEQILNVFPDNRMALNNWNKSYTELKEKKAYIKKIYEKAVTLFNNQQYNVSLLYFDFINRYSPGYGNSRKLRSLCKNYLDKEQKKGKKIEEMYNSALLDFINNDYYLAMNKWEYILKKEPGNVRARYFLNRTLNILNRREPAIISDISQSDLKKINGLYYKGIIEYINGNYEKALLFWREILKIYPGHLRALYNINKIMLTLKKQR